MQLRIPGTIIGVVVCSAMTLAACGGSEELSAEQYFQRVSAISEEGNDKLDALMENDPDIDFDSTEEEIIQAIRDPLREMLDVMKKMVSDLKGVNPPEELGRQHDELVRTYEDGQKFFEDFGDQLQDANTMADVISIVEELDREFSSIDRAFINACRELQNAANSRGIGSDLMCEG